MRTFVSVLTGVAVAAAAVACGRNSVSSDLSADLARVSNGSLELASSQQSGVRVVSPLEAGNTAATRRALAPKPSPTGAQRAQADRIAPTAPTNLAPPVVAAMPVPNFPTPVAAALPLPAPVVAVPRAQPNSPNPVGDPDRGSYGGVGTSAGSAPGTDVIVSDPDHRRGPVVIRGGGSASDPCAGHDGPTIPVLINTRFPTRTPGMALPATRR